MLESRLSQNLQFSGAVPWEEFVKVTHRSLERGRAALFVVPIRVGGGTRLKIFEAMAMGKPVVSTTIGAEGLPLTPGKDIIIADEPIAMTGAIEGLLTNPDEAKALGGHSARLVQEKFGWDAVSREFARICESVVEASHREGRGARRMESDG